MNKTHHPGDRQHSMGDHTLRVFVSATTGDLARYRVAVKEELLTANILPVSQENFGPDYRSLTEFLKIEVSKCDAVICLVGFVFGAAPNEPADKRRSYTQMEYDFAMQYKKPLFVFLADESYLPDSVILESDEEKELQRRYREFLMTSGPKWELFSDVQELKVKISRAIRKVERLPAQSPMFYLHLPRRPSYFAGRLLEMEQLNEALLREAPAVIVVMGMGGQGKTTLVHKVLGDLKSFPFAAGFWCTAYRGGFTFDMFLDEVLAYLLKGDFDKRTLPDLNMRITRLLGVLQQQPTLLVIDGIERWLSGWNSGTKDPQFAETERERTGFHAGLDDFLQQASSLVNGTHLILTTRALPAALDQAARVHIPVREENSEDLTLDGLDSVSSVDLLQNLGVKGSPDQLRKVSGRYANHPLALTVLGTLVKKKHGGELDRLPADPVSAPNQELRKLFDDLRTNLPGRENAERFLKVASQCFENPSLSTIAAGISGGLTSTRSDVSFLLDEAVTLADWSVVSWNGAAQKVNLHPLVKNYFSTLLTEVESGRIHRDLSAWYGTLPISDSATSLEEVTPRILSIKHATFCGDIERAADLIFGPLAEGYSFFTWLGEWGHQFSAIELLGVLLEKATGALRGEFLLARSNMYHQLARPQLAIGDIEEAIVIYEKLRNAGGKGIESNLAKALATRGNIHHETASSSVAILDFNRAIEMMELMGNHDFHARMDLFKMHVNRGNAYYSTGALSRAILDYERAYELWGRFASDRPEWSKPSLASLLTTRGIAFLDIGKINRAIADFEEAIVIGAHEESYSLQEQAKHVAYAKAMLGMALEGTERKEEALIFVSEAVAMFQKFVDAGRKDFEPFFALALVNRATVYMTHEKWHEALNDCNRSILIYQRLVNEAGLHFATVLARAQCRRAAIRYELGDRSGSQADRNSGFSTMRQHIREWPSESEIRIEFLREALKAVHYLLPSSREEGITVLNELLDEYDRTFSETQSTEAMRCELRGTAASIDRLIYKMELSGCETVRVNELIEKIKRLK